MASELHLSFPGILLRAKQPSILRVVSLWVRPLKPFSRIQKQSRRCKHQTNQSEAGQTLSTDREVFCLLIKVRNLINNPNPIHAGILNRIYWNSPLIKARENGPCPCGKPADTHTHKHSVCDPFPLDTKDRHGVLNHVTQSVSIHFPVALRFDRWADA